MYTLNVEYPFELIHAIAKPILIKSYIYFLDNTMKSVVHVFIRWFSTERS